MKARRFYRSRLFWLGVPGLVFLLWAWWDSGGHWSGVEWEHGNSMDDVSVADGWVRWRRDTYLKPPTPTPVYGADEFMAMRHESCGVGPDGKPDVGTVRGRQFDFYAAFEEDRSLVEELILGPHEVVEFRVGLWAVVLGYAVVWMGAVIAWERRKARVMAGLTETSEGMEAVS